MTPEEYVATLKPPNNSPRVIGTFWGEQLGHAPLLTDKNPSYSERWRSRLVDLDDGELFPYGLLVQAAIPQVTMTPDTADAFMETVDILEPRVKPQITPAIAYEAAIEVFSQEKATRLGPPLNTSRVTILNWTLGLLPEPEQRLAAVKAGVDEAPRSLSTGKFLKSTPDLIEGIQDPALREAAQEYAASRPSLTRTKAEALRNRTLRRSALDAGDPATGVPKQPRRRL